MFKQKPQIYMEYSISRTSISSQFIQIRLKLTCKQNEFMKLQLAAWRPGRYELANYAQKIRSFSVSHQKTQVAWSKASKDLWTFQASSQGVYWIDYEFYCNQLDAGGCWSDDTMLYLNFTNFAFDIIGRSDEPIQVNLDLPSNYTIATSLEGVNTISAPCYQVLIDSPVLCSPNLKQYCYQIDESNFKLWIYGEIHFDISELLIQFENFTKLQIADFGEFPSKDYHFIFILLPFPHYHGVEHAHSTVITFGPAEDLKDPVHLDRLMGVSSHEFYHFWNVCRIRPKELLPYDLSKEVLLDTGLVLEGVTTYMGDLYLLKSGYYAQKAYLTVLTKLIQRESDNLGWQNQSIVESSLDLWLDGYRPGIPDKKTNIYNRGALISFCLDVLLLEIGSSLSKVMREMWERFGKQRLGYQLQDFIAIIMAHSDSDVEVEQFIQNFVFGRNDLLPVFTETCRKLGFEVLASEDGDTLLHKLGIRTDSQQVVTQIHPTSEAYQHIMLGDVIVVGESQMDLTLNSNNSISVAVIRKSKKLIFDIPVKNEVYFLKLTILSKEVTALNMRWSR